MRCANCPYDNAPEARYCGNCGSTLDEQTEPQLADAVARFQEGDRQLQAGDVEAAIAEFTAAITLHPHFGGRLPPARGCASPTGKSR